MKKIISIFTLLFVNVALTACSSISPGEHAATVQAENTAAANQFDPAATAMGPMEATNEATGGSVGGSIESMMTDEDKLKMSRALDGATGKLTHWVNGARGVSYTVTPIRKVVVEGKPFCREYSMTATRGGNTQQVGGTACVASDGNWHAI